MGYKSICRLGVKIATGFSGLVLVATSLSARSNVFVIACDEVTGDAGLFNRFLQLDDGEALPYPWRLLKDAVGAPKFSSRPGVGFRVQIIQN